MYISWPNIHTCVQTHVDTLQVQFISCFHPPKHAMYVVSIMSITTMTMLLHNRHRLQLAQRTGFMMCFMKQGNRNSSPLSTSAPMKHTTSKVEINWFRQYPDQHRERVPRPRRSVHHPHRNMEGDQMYSNTSSCSTTKSEVCSPCNSADEETLCGRKTSVGGHHYDKGNTGQLHRRSLSQGHSLGRRANTAKRRCVNMSIRNIKAAKLTAGGCPRRCHDQFTTEDVLACHRIFCPPPRSRYCVMDNLCPRGNYIRQIFPPPKVSGYMNTHKYSSYISQYNDVC
jgi:hypothetical protein